MHYDGYFVIINYSRRFSKFDHFSEKKSLLQHKGYETVKTETLKLILLSKMILLELGVDKITLKRG